MISFNCSCGKKYQLPDRVAGREVRCNQCQKTFLVPKQSQNDPVVPLDDLETTEPAPMPKINPNEPASLPPPEKRSNQPPQSDRFQTSKTGTESIDSNSAWGAVPLPTVGSADRIPTDGNFASNEFASGGMPKKTFSWGACLLLFAAMLVSLLIGYFVRGAIDDDTASDGIQQEIISDSVPLESKSGSADADQGLIAPTAKKEYSFKDWKLADGPIAFAAKTADGKPVSLSLGGDPVEVSSGNQKEDVLKVVASEFSDDNTEHTISLQIRSESPETLRVIWPGEYPTQLDGSKIKEFQFSVYLSDKANTAFRPGKPEGLDKVLELADFSLRLCAETGYTEFVPADMEKLASFIEKARKGWQSIQIPAHGDENWKRLDHGLVGPLSVQRIELHARPTGNGIVFWLDNLNIVTD